MLHHYRALGADLPFTDLRRGHGVAMEGYFWRLSDVRSGRVIVALCGVCRAPDGVWATVALAGYPSGFIRQVDVMTAAADPRRLGVRAGEGILAGDRQGISVHLGADAQLEASLRDQRGWTRRGLGGSGVAHLIPGLGQYWHPHVLGARVQGRAVLGEEVIDLEGFDAYAEKNWGRGGFPPRWWWGQAQGFDRPDVCVAFAGGDLQIGPATIQATALVVRIGSTMIRLGNPVLAPVRAVADRERWLLHGRGPVWSAELEGGGPEQAAHILPVPLPGERRSVPGALEHLGATLRLVVRRRGRVVFGGTSTVAGLELGGLEAVAGLVGERGRQLS